jgi:NitT/TauT family transport system ATP-binding protein
MKKILEITNLKKYYHDEKSETLAIENISFDVYENEFISIVGTSGCGKSTLLSILAGLENKSDGSISLNKKDFRIGYMLQKDSLFPWRTILDNCLLGLEIENKITDEKKEKVISLLDKYGLKDFKYKYPSSLSGGMRQRVALIRTLATSPDLLLLDEPLSSLDYQTRISLSNDLYKIIKDEKKTAIMVTHDLGDVNI